jgi:hypothetical protein
MTDVTHLDVARDALAVAARCIDEALGGEVIYDDLEDDGERGELFNLWFLVRLAQAAGDRVRLATMVPPPKKKKSKTVRRDR